MNPMQEIWDEFFDMAKFIGMSDQEAREAADAAISDRQALYEESMRAGEQR